MVLSAQEVTAKYYGWVMRISLPCLLLLLSFSLTAGMMELGFKSAFVHADKLVPTSGSELNKFDGRQCACGDLTAYPILPRGQRIDRGLS